MTKLQKLIVLGFSRVKTWELKYFHISFSAMAGFSMKTRFPQVLARSKAFP